MNDFRYALRTFRNQPGFAIVTVTLIALGIGASGIVFAAADALLLRRLAAREPSRLFEVIQTLPQLGKRSAHSWEIYTALRDRATQLAGVTAESYRDVALTEPGPAEQIRVHFVSADYFAVLGVDAALGRTLIADDRDAVVISDGFWKRRFAADPAAIGKTLTIRGHRFTIVGVLPREFNGFSMDTAPDIRLPLAALQAATSERETIQHSFFEIGVRSRDGVSVEQASAEANSIWRAATIASAEKTPDWQIEKGVQLEPLIHGVSRLRDRFSSALAFLGAAVGLLMLMVCANVAGLLLARSAQRESEIAVRIALGASRWRLIRQMLAESLLLASMGCFGGIAITYAATPMLVRALPPIRDLTASSLPLSMEIQPNLRVLAASVVVALLAVLLFGLAPALRASRIGSNRVTRGWNGQRLLVAAEVALCTLLLTAAGLLVRTFESLHTMDAGFDRDHVVTFTMNPALNGYDALQSSAFADELINRVRVVPGVHSAAIASIGLMRGTGMKTTVARTGEKTTPADFLNSSINSISPDYFESMGMRIIAGRGFSAADKVCPTRIPVVVNRAFVQHFFPTDDPIRKTFGTGANIIVKDTYEIAGVATDAHYRSLREPIPPTIYTPPCPEHPVRFVLHVRAAMRPEAVIGPVREIVRAIDPQLPIIETHTLSEEVDATLWSERLVASLASIFGALAAILAAIGLFGLLAYTVAQRTREIGIRVALGADPSNVFALIGTQAAILSIVGILVGLIAARLALPLANALLYGVAPNDPATLTFSALFVAAIAALATAVPVARALRVDPAIALRQD